MTTTTQTLTGKELFLAQFEDFEMKISRNGQAWLAPMRKQALARFEELDFPTPRNEDWKHTNVAPVTKIAFRPSDGAKALTQARERFEEYTFKGLNAIRLVFVNGVFSKELSSSEGSTEGAVVANLSESMRSHRDVVERHLGKIAPYEDHAFVALNTAFHSDGAFVYLKKGTILDRPVNLVFLTTDSPHPVAAHPRNLIVLEESAQATVVERYVGLAENVYFNNAVTEIAVGENANLDHYRLQEESPLAFHFGNLQAIQKANSHFSSHLISTGALLNRNDAGSILDGEGGHCALNGIFLTHDKQHVDNHTRLDHAKPHCTSHELFKGILDGHSTGAFTGRIIVRPGAQKTDAIQSSRNLLLSDNARINPDPQLEIYADDVRCTHGATIGQLDEDALFYLGTRGIDPDSAKGLLTYAFANELIEHIKVEPIREKLERFIAERYRKGSR
jgi:Fe-S cluster assembly protein SufD